MFKCLYGIILLMSMMACSYAVQPETIELQDQVAYNKYLGSSGSSDIQFDIQDYVGIWSDPSGREYYFELTKDLNLIMGWRNGKCTIAEQTNNNLLLKCSGELAGSKKGGRANVQAQYVNIKIFYYSDSTTHASKRIHITFNQNKDCAKKGSADKECWKSGSDDENIVWLNKEYKMYKKIN